MLRNNRSRSIYLEYTHTFFATTSLATTKFRPAYEASQARSGIGCNCCAIQIIQKQVLSILNKKEQLQRLYQSTCWRMNRPLQVILPSNDSVRSDRNIKGILTKLLAIFQICPKLCVQVEDDYTNWFPKFQVRKRCGSWDITSKSVWLFGERVYYFYIPLTYDVVCIWLLNGQSQSVIVIVREK